MAPVDEPLAGAIAADEVWVWPVPHPLDPDRSQDVAVTRIGRRDGDRFVGHLAIVSSTPRLRGGVVHGLTGLGDWARHRVGDLGLPRFVSDHRAFDARPRSGDVEGRWTATGCFAVGDAVEASAVASRGRPPRTGDGWRGAAGNALDIGRSLARLARGDRDAFDTAPVPPLGEEVASPLTALGGWLTATQHRTPDGDRTAEAWQLGFDPAQPAPTSPGMAVVIAALGLVHCPQLVYGRPA